MVENDFKADRECAVGAGYKGAAGDLHVGDQYLVLVGLHTGQRDQEADERVDPVGYALDISFVRTVIGVLAVAGGIPPGPALLMELMDTVGHPGVFVVVESILISDKLVVVRVADIGVIPDGHLHAGNDLAPVKLVRLVAVKPVLFQERLHVVDSDVGIGVDDDGAELLRGSLAVISAVLQVDALVQAGCAGRRMRVGAVNDVVIALAVLIKFIGNPLAFIVQDGAVGGIYKRH